MFPAVLGTGQALVARPFGMPPPSSDVGWACLAPISRSYRPRRLIGMTMRSSATVSQPTPPTRPESLEPPVARLTTYAELAARLYQRHSPSLTLFNEPYLFVFRARPGQHIPPDRFAPIFVQCVTHVPGFSVTNVPGLYPPSPVRGRGDVVLQRWHNSQTSPPSAHLTQRPACP